MRERGLLFHVNAEQLAQKLAQKTGGPAPDAIVRALEAQLVGLEMPDTTTVTRDAILEIVARCKALPDLDPRSADAILGYGKAGCVGWVSGLIA